MICRRSTRQLMPSPMASVRRNNQQQRVRDCLQCLPLQKMAVLVLSPMVAHQLHSWMDITIRQHQIIQH